MSKGSYKKGIVYICPLDWRLFATYVCSQPEMLAGFCLRHVLLIWMTWSKNVRPTVFAKIRQCKRTLRCIDVEDKSLSMAFNVVFMSLLAMLPSPMVYGTLIDSTCILWQEECGETANCLLYDTVSLRKTLMLTTGFIMLGGVAFDGAVWYYSKDVVIFNPEQERLRSEANKRGQADGGESEETEEEETFSKADSKFASTLSLTKGDLYRSGVPLGSS